MFIFYVGANDYYCTRCGKHVDNDGKCLECDYPTIKDKYGTTKIPNRKFERLNR